MKLESYLGIKMVVMFDPDSRKVMLAIGARSTGVEAIEAIRILVRKNYSHCSLEQRCIDHVAEPAPTK